MRFEAKTLRVILLAGALAAAASALAAPMAAAQARARKFDPALLENGDLIGYRALTREDFRAGEPPGEIAGLHDQLGAATCVFLATHPRMFVRSSSGGADALKGQYRAWVEDLAFLAYMDRECSWWNPAPLDLPADYILQHEQIHFAFFEIAARRLNREADELAKQLEALSSSHEQAIHELRRRLDRRVQREIDAIVERSDQLDRDTSRSYRLEHQDRWWQTVNEELRALAEAAAPEPGRTGG
jgi:hypothetical protein